MKKEKKKNTSFSGLYALYGLIEGIIVGSKINIGLSACFVFINFFASSSQLAESVKKFPGDAKIIELLLTDLASYFYIIVLCACLLILFIAFCIEDIIKSQIEE